MPHMTETTDAIEELIGSLAQHETRVELSDVTGGVAIKITGPTKEAVQHHMNRQFDLTETKGGICSFNGPYKFPDGHWVALGERIP